MKNRKKKALNLQTLKELFNKSSDIQFESYTFHNQQITFITCDAMVDKQMFQQVVVERIQKFLEKKENNYNNLHLPQLTKITNKTDAISKVYSGFVLIYFSKTGELFASDITDRPNRQPEETKTEVPVKGPRDNFIEDLSVNIALVRKRLPTNSLCVETFRIGRRTKTKIAMLYFDDIAKPEILKGIRDKLNKIDVDIVFSGNILMEHIDKNSRLFPRHDYTGRPDLAIQSLVRGRILILIDGVAYGVITPVSLFQLFKTAEDNEYPSIYSTFERLLRVFGVFVGALLPAFWLALITYHQNQLPLLLLATVFQSNTGLPFPSVIEMLIMLILFELFREAGLRLPESIGGTLSVVGGLIIGDAAIRSGVTSPAMIVVIAVSTVATFTLLNQSLVAAVSIIRFIAIIVTSFFGLFGFFMVFYFTLLYVANIRVFGAPYLNITANLSSDNIKKTLFRPLQKFYKTRPVEVATNDITRINEDEE
ncbi:MAG TPA: spore germination protein [Cerasibacillus sp.]|uniref:spore germination protein n=1 Tax=Cerasibacillus sp. TaxID=2498711 RepID=UPI002F3EBBD3